MRRSHVGSVGVRLPPLPNGLISPKTSVFFAPTFYAYALRRLVVKDRKEPKNWKGDSQPAIQVPHPCDEGIDHCRGAGQD